MAASISSVESISTPESISFAQFLETSPPNQSTRIEGIWNVYQYQGEDSYRGIITPEIQLHCSGETCNGPRFFRCISRPPALVEGKFVNAFLTYRCWNCQKVEKLFSVSVRMDSHQKSYLQTGDALKLGEQPPFGPPTPARLIKLIGPDRDAFLKGRRCENQGLGIGAFVYYRRVVENQRSRILGEILQVAERVGAKPEAIETLKKAAAETQFSKAIDLAKSAIPESLLINGHNPLALLHSALSEGVHELTDDECLTIAGSIRVILAELSERLGQALKDEVELKQALDTLMNRPKPAEKPPRKSTPKQKEE